MLMAMYTLWCVWSYIFCQDIIRLKPSIEEIEVNWDPHNSSEADYESHEIYKIELETLLF